MNRAQAVENAVQSMQLEGFVFTPEELDVWEKVAAGELSLDDLLETFIRFNCDMRQKYPELYEQERRLFKNVSKRKRRLE